MPDCCSTQQLSRSTQRSIYGRDRPSQPNPQTPELCVGLPRYANTLARLVVLAWRNAWTVREHGLFVWTGIQVRGRPSSGAARREKLSKVRLSLHACNCILLSSLLVMRTLYRAGIRTGMNGNECVVRLCTLVYDEFVEMSRAYLCAL